MSKKGSSMNCEDAQLFIDAYVDGEFEERERTEFELHLEDNARAVDARSRVASSGQGSA